MFAAALLCAAGFAEEDAGVAKIDSRLQLLVDESIIESLDGAQLTLHSPVDRGIVFRFDRPWEGPQSAYVTILRDGDRYRMYYRGGGDLGREYTCMAASADGVHWERPALGLFPFQGSAANNIIWTGKKKAYFLMAVWIPFWERVKKTSLCL